VLRKATNPFKRVEPTNIRLLKAEPAANLEDADRVVFDRNPEFPVKELPNEPRMLDSAREEGTTFRAIAAFSQMSRPSPEKLLVERISPADRFSPKTCQPVPAEFRVPDGGDMEPRPAAVPPKECHCPSAKA
jgi:hypothetical protein